MDTLNLKTFQKLLLSVDRVAACVGPLLLLVIAGIYYGSYFDNGLNLGGEGGTNAVIAMRLMEGQRPIADTFLGYNLLWFHPIVWIFEWTGPNYLAMRGFFFVLCTITSLLGFWTVLRVTRFGLPALAAGLCLVLIPGMLFRNYMGLMAVANQLAMVSAFLLPAGREWRRMALIGISGLVLGITFLIRVEVGLLMSLIWCGLLVLNLIRPGHSWRRNFMESLFGGTLGVVLFLAVHVPFAIDAHRRNYASDFYGQYSAFTGMLRWELQQQLTSKTPPEPVSPAAEQNPGAAQETAQVEPGSGRKPRPGCLEMFTKKRLRDRYFAAAIYWPIVAAILLILASCCSALKGLITRKSEPWITGLTLGTLTGCALTLFPQYFFFRPDTPHISEFMVPMIVALFSAAGMGVGMLLKNRTAPSLVVASLAAALLAVSVWIHFGHAWRKESAGTMAARKHGPAVFEGLNGVRVRMEPDKAHELAAMQKIIVSHSTPEDWVIALPYSPTINFMTNRRSYLYDLYTDNTMAGEGFDAARIAEVEKYHPAVIVIDHRAINASEGSRFPNWAPVFYQYVTQNYRRAGEFLNNEVFVRNAIGQ